MTIKKLYIEPGTSLDIHLITRDDLPLSAAGWREQLRPEKLLLTIDSHTAISTATFSTKISYGMGRKDPHHPEIEYLRDDLRKAQAALHNGLTMPAELKIQTALARLDKLLEPANADV